MKTLTTLSLLCVLCVGCNYVEQEVDTKRENFCKIMVGASPCIRTYVWLNLKIVHSSTLPITADSATIKHHLDSANAILNNLERLK